MSEELPHGMSAEQREGYCALVEEVSNDPLKNSFPVGFPRPSQDGTFHVDDIPYMAKTIEGEQTLFHLRAYTLFAAQAVLGIGQRVTDESHAKQAGERNMYGSGYPGPLRKAVHDRVGRKYTYVDGRYVETSRSPKARRRVEHAANTVIGLVEGPAPKPGPEDKNTENWPHRVRQGTVFMEKVKV